MLGAAYLQDGWAEGSAELGRVSDCQAGRVGGDDADERCVLAGAARLVESVRAAGREVDYCDVCNGASEAEFALDSGLVGERAVKERDAIDLFAVEFQKTFCRDDAVQGEWFEACCVAAGLRLFGEPVGGCEVDGGTGAVDALGVVFADCLGDAVLGGGHRLHPMASGRRMR